jgi:RNA polymerase-binding protein DksA
VAKSTSKKASRPKPHPPSARKAAAPRRPAKPAAPARTPIARKQIKLKGESRPGPTKAQPNSKPLKPPPGHDRRRLPVVEAPPPPVPGKPVKNLAGLKTRELEGFRDTLIAKRRELLGDVHSMEEEALRSATGSNLSNLPIHMADMGTDNYEQEFTLGLVEKDRQLLREINNALIKIRDGSYGICEGTSKPISKARLEAKPWARHSIEYTRKMEKGLIRK